MSPQKFSPATTWTAPEPPAEPAFAQALATSSNAIAPTTSSLTARLLHKSIAQPLSASGWQLLPLDRMPRPSPVSDEVSRLLASGERHAWSLAELLDGVRRTVAGANYSSVFRSMTALEEAGVVDRLDLGDGASRYELRDRHHEHVVCESCGRVAEVRDCVVDDAAARIQHDTGFSVRGHHVVFVGRCAD